MKKFSFSVCIFLLLVMTYGCNGSVPSKSAEPQTITQTQAEPLPSPKDIQQRIQTIYADVFSAFKQGSSSPSAEKEQGFDKQYCSQEWLKLTQAVRQHDDKFPGELGFFDFDYWINAQDFCSPKVTNVQVEQVTSQTASALIIIDDCIEGCCYYPRERPVRLNLVKEAGEWRIDNFQPEVRENEFYNMKESMKKYLNK